MTRRGVALLLFVSVVACEGGGGPHDEPCLDAGDTGGCPEALADARSPDGAPPDAAPPDGARPADAGATYAPAPVLTEAGEVSFDSDGVSDALTIALRPAEYLGLRVEIPDVPEACLQVHSAQLDDGTWRVEAPTAVSDYGEHCVGCAQRARVGAGRGLFVFPNDGRAIAAPATLSVRFVVRDCLLLVPWLDAGIAGSSGRVQALTLRSRPAATAATLDVVLHTGDRGWLSGVVSIDSSDYMRDATRTVETLIGQANISPRFTLRNDLHPPAVSEVTAVGRITPAAVGLTTVESGRTPIHVYLIGCIQRVGLRDERIDTAGFSSGIPVGYPAEESVDGVFVSSGPCPDGVAEAPNAQRLGATMAHELGHALGLYHSRDGDGGGDHLADTDGDDLMSYDVAFERLNPMQAVVLRSHPSLR